MEDASIYKNTIISKVVTPYRKLRKINRLSTDDAASILGCSAASLNKYEIGAVGVPKYLIGKMDELYGCRGKLINYWLTDDKMSAVCDETARDENKKRANVIIIKIIG